MLTKISRGICLHRVHTVSATITPINPRECTDLEITFMKYGRNWPRIFGLNACGIFFNIFSAKSSKKSLYTKNHSEHVLWLRFKSYSKYKAGNLPLLDPNLCRRNKKKKENQKKKPSDESIRHRVLQMGCLNIM